MGAIKVIVILTLLPAHAPVCKVAAVEACTHTSTAPTSPPCSAPPCCAKCAKKPADSPAPVPSKQDRPTKQSCPTNCLSPLCTVFSAVVSDTCLSSDFDQLTPELLPVALQLSSPDGFHTLLDRPPRA